MKALLSRRYFWAFLLPLLVIAVYSPGLSGGFIFDDYPNIISNPRVHAESLDAQAIVKAAGAYEPGTVGRPLSTISFAANHAATGKNPSSYKLTSVAVHAVNASLVFLLVTLLLSTSGNSASAPITAGIIAAAWALHPLQVSTVLYVVQRMEMLAATFILASLACYLHGRNRQRDGARGWPWLLTAGLLAVAGLSGKETALLTPVYALALELTVLGFAAKSERSGRLLRLGWAGGVLAALLVYAFIVLPPYLDPQVYSLRDWGLVERLLSQLRVLPMYLGWIVAPLPNSLVFYYDDFEASRGLLTPLTTLGGGLLLAGLLALAIATRRRAPILALGVFWFFASHVLTSNVMPFELVFEHRNYLAILGPLLAAFVLFQWLGRRGLDTVAVIAPVLLVVGLAGLAMLRSANWGDPLLLAMHHVALNRDSPRASNDLGEQYFLMSDNSPDSPFYQFAMREFERGSQLSKSSPLPEQAMIILSATAGGAVDPAWWDGIDRKLSERPIGPQEGMAVLGLMRKRLGGLPIDDERLMRSLELLFEKGRMPPSSHAEFGEYALTIANRPDLATRLFVQSVSVEPRDPAYGRQILNVLVSSGHAEQAAAVHARLVELGDIAAD